LSVLTNIYEYALKIRRRHTTSKQRCVFFRPEFDRRSTSKQRCVPTGSSGTCFYVEYTPHLALKGLIFLGKFTAFF